jgi:hypothetical protein
VPVLDSQTTALEYEANIPPAQKTLEPLNDLILPPHVSGISTADVEVEDIHHSKISVEHQGLVITAPLAAGVTPLDHAQVVQHSPPPPQDILKKRTEPQFEQEAEQEDAVMEYHGDFSARKADLLEPQTTSSLVPPVTPSHHPIHHQEAPISLPNPPTHSLDAPVSSLHRPLRVEPSSTIVGSAVLEGGPAVTTNTPAAIYEAQEVAEGADHLSPPSSELSSLPSSPASSALSSLPEDMDI